MVLISCPECQKQVSSQAATCPNCGVAIAGAGAPLPTPGPPPSAEQQLWRGTPSVALLVGKMAWTALALVVLPTLAVFLHSFLVGPHAPEWLSSFVRSHSLGTVLSLMGVVALLLVPSLFDLLATLARIKSLRYTLTSQRLLIERGLFSKSLEEIDLRYVDETQFSQGFLERLLGIGEVRVVSSDKLAPNLVLRGIRDPRGVRELVRANAYQASQRQFFTRST